jgi:hypothetical protein
MSVTRKLIIAMFVIGGALATMNTGLTGFDSYRASSQALDAAQKANVDAVAKNEQLNVELAATTDPKEREALQDQKQQVSPISWAQRYGWLLATVLMTVAAFGSLVLVCAMLWKRQEGMPITWAEAMIYSTVFFFYLVIANGFIPHYMIQIWDASIAPNLAEPMTVVGTKQIASIWNENALGLQWSWNTLRDIVVSGWYVVVLLATILGIYWAQEWPKRQAKEGDTAKAITSPYGRPMLQAGD